MSRIDDSTACARELVAKLVAFQGKSEAGHMVTIDWPGELPFDVEVGDIFEFEYEERWVVITLPGGQFARVVDLGTVLQPDFRLVDGIGTVEHDRGCSWREHMRILSATLRSQGDEAVLLPGEEAKVGEWTYRMQLSVEAGNLSGVDGAHVWEPDGEMAGILLLAYREI